MLSIIADVESTLVLDESSSNITPTIWQTLAETIKKNNSKYSGFVIMHGQDNLLYTASAVSFLLHNLGKPVIFTSGQADKGRKTIFGKRQAMGLRANLVNAIQVATLSLPETSIVYGNRLLRANSSRQTKDENNNIVAAYPEAELGKIDFSIRLFEKNILKAKKKTKAAKGLGLNIKIIRVTPVLSANNLINMVSGNEALLLDMSNYHDIPESILDALEKLSVKIPTILYSTSESDFVLRVKNVIPVNNMTLETAVVKFMWAIKQTKDVVRIKKIMRSNIAGELRT